MPHERPDETDTSGWPTWSASAVALVVVGAIVLLLAWSAPLTYDEAANWLSYRPLGWWKIATTYDVPNNHVPYTLLHTLVPQWAVDRTPWALRAFAVLIGTALVMTVLQLSRRVGTSRLVPVLLISASPLMVCYLFVARSYGAGSLIAIGAAIAATRRANDRWAVAAASAGLAIASWALPTNAFLVPGWIAVVLLVSGWRLAAAATVNYAGLTCLLFLPIADDVLDQADRQWAYGEQTIGHLPEHASYIPLLLAAALMVAVVDGTRRWRLNAPGVDVRTRSPRARLALGCGLMVASWFIVLAAGFVVGMQLPFDRNAVPALWLGTVALIAAFPIARVTRLVAIGLLVPAALVGVFSLVSATRDGRWDRISVVLGSTTAVTIRDLHSSAADRLDCSSFDAPVCLISIPMLERAGVTMGLVELTYRTDLPCVLGTTPPDPPFQAIAYRGGDMVGILCN